MPVARNGQGIIAIIIKKASPKYSSIRLCFWASLLLLLTMLLPMCTNSQAIIIITTCSNAKKRMMLSFITSLAFVLSMVNHIPLKYRIRPISNWISQNIINNKLLLLSAAVYFLLPKTPDKALSKVQSPKNNTPHLKIL